MRQLIVLVIGFVFIGCNSELKAKKENLADINLTIKSETKIDSIWISNFGQTESFYLPFKDTIRVNFESRLDDLYNIEFFTKNGSKSSQLWLDGEHVIVETTLNNKIEIDKVINSDLYPKSKEFSKLFGKFVNNDSDSITIDRFLLKNIRDNVNSPFSFAIANNFIHRNQNNKEKIKQLSEELSVQSDTLKKHILSIHGEIENILKVDNLNIGDYSFTDKNDELATINIKDDKTYLLDLWFVKCPPCLKDHKLINTKKDFLKNNNIELIGISTDKDYNEWKNYLKKNNYNWKNYREIDSLQTITTDMGIWSFPTYLHLDKNGKIKSRYNSFSDFEKNLKNKILK